MKQNTLHRISILPNYETLSFQSTPKKVEIEDRANVPKIGDYFTAKKSELPSLLLLQRQAIAACASCHVRPFSIVQDIVFHWAYNCQVKNWKRISEPLSELANDWRRKINESLAGKFVTVSLDGCTNPITGQSHMGYMASTRDNFFI